MTDEKIERLAAKLASIKTLDYDILDEVAQALKPRFPGITADHKGDGITEASLHLVEECLPGWTILLRGKAMDADGNWQCTLREATTRDSDAVIGSGKGPTVSLSIVKALVKVSMQSALP